jgi:signal transduction histidine kinase
LHPLLRRQLKRLGLDEGSPPGEKAWAQLLERVSRAYGESDQDRYALERSLSVSSRDLEHSAAVIQATQEAAAEGILVVDEQRKTRTLNRRFVEMWRIPERLLTSRSEEELWAFVLGAIAEPERFQERLGVLGGHPQEPSRDEIALRDGRIFEHYSTPLQSVQEVVGRVWSFRDVTERKRNEEELRQAKDTAEKASRTKSEFLANVSHELRTPLNSILGFARVLEHGAYGDLNEWQRTYLGNILRASEHMLELVNDLLDLRQLTESRAPLEVEVVPLADVIEEVLSLVKPLVDERRHSVELAVPADLVGFRTNRRALVQILESLLSNAAKYTLPGGHIEVRARRNEQGDFELAVKDSGIGIALEDQPRLFQYFERLGGKHAHQMRGAGIGLALTRALLERLGGAIRVTSALGMGSTFTCTFPGERIP